MIDEQLVARGVTDDSVLRAMSVVPRECFVPSDAVADAYRGDALSIGRGQTIAEPYTVAHMIELAKVESDDRVLDVGTGTGYGAAVLSRLALRVFSIERQEVLAAVARELITKLGYSNVEITAGDGTLGWAEHGPFDAIIVGAGGPWIPDSLIDQLAEGGRLVMPVGECEHSQRLMKVVRTGPRSLFRVDLGPVEFVPLIGADGWPARLRVAV